MSEPVQSKLYPPYLEITIRLRLTRAPDNPNSSMFFKFGDSCCHIKDDGKEIGEISATLPGGAPVFEDRLRSIAYKAELEDMWNAFQKSLEEIVT